MKIKIDENKDFETALIIFINSLKYKDWAKASRTAAIEALKLILENGNQNEK